jgi:uncharacterized protein
MSIPILVIVFLLLTVSLIGIFIPFVPGLLLGWIGFLIYIISADLFSSNITLFVLITFFTLFASFSDTLFSLMGAKMYDSSKYGIIGGVVGLVVGLLVFPPFGLVVGPFVGIYLGEIVGGKNTIEASHSLWGALVGFLISIGLKLIVWGAIITSLLYLISV